MKSRSQHGWIIPFGWMIRTVFAVLWLFFCHQNTLGQVNYAFKESSNPAGLITSTTNQVAAGTVRRVSNFAVVSGTYRFGFWTANGIRQGYSNGQALMLPELTVNGPVDAVANFFPMAEDGDGDRLPDWWEYWMFGDRSRGPQDDDDGDGQINEVEYRNGFSARFVDQVRAGGVSSRLSAPLRMIVRNRLRYSLRSEPLGLVSAEGELAPGESYTSPHLIGDTSSYTFIGFEVNGQVVRDVTGYYLNRITVTPQSAMEIIARYVPAGSDGDADGIPDAIEWQNFGTLGNGPGSDPDGDGLSIEQERRMGLSLVTKDRIQDGGIAARLSAPLDYDRIRSRYSVQSMPLGLVASSSELVQNGTERTTAYMGATLVSGYAFGYWSVNGQRVAGPDGTARRQVKLTVNGPSDLVANLFLPDQDSDSDGMPDWWEWSSFGGLGYSQSSDPDGDGLTLADERREGLSVTTRDALRDGGIAARLSAPLQYESGSRKRFAVRSAPLGIVAVSQQYLAANTEVATAYYLFNQLYSGYYFTHWTRNGSRVADSQGHSRNRADFPLTEDTDMVANFVLPNDDLDGDSIPDYLELRIAPNYSALGPNSDPDGDGIAIAGEQRMGLAPLLNDVIRDGGIASRLSAPAELKFSVPPLTLMPNPLRVLKDAPLGTSVGDLSVSPVLSGRSYQYALELGTGADDNARFGIVGNELRLASSLSLNQRVYWIRIRATDDLGVIRIYQTSVFAGSAAELAEPPSFATWLAQSLAPNPSSANADPDGDGISNLVEYVLGGNPSSHDRLILPRTILLSGNLVFTFNRPDGSETTDVSLAVETSSDLANWTQSYTISPGIPAPQVSIEENGSDPDTITVTIPASAGKRFARLKVEVEP